MFTNLLLCNVITILIVSSVHGSGKIPGDVAKSKCKEYSQYVKNPAKCNTGLLPRDQFAPEGNMPHMAALRYQNEGELLCGGALISEDFVLVPAHCIRSKLGNIEAVRLGFTNLDSSEHSQIIKVKKVIHHPEFKPPALYNDIGLVQLEKKIDANDYVRPACLHTQAEVEEEQAIIGGWGTTDPLGGLEPRLLKFSIKFYDSTKCNDTYKSSIGSKMLEKGITSETMLCVVSTETDFQVKSGGLQIVNKDNTCMYDIIGVASFGKIAPRVPEVHTRVSAYISWIEQVVWGKEN